jgi:hypothetical protein
MRGAHVLVAEEDFLVELLAGAQACNTSGTASGMVMKSGASPGA